MAIIKALLFGGLFSLVFLVIIWIIAWIIPILTFLLIFGGAAAIAYSIFKNDEVSKPR